CGGDPGGDGGPRRARADEQGRQGGGRRRPAAGAERLQQRGLLQPEPVGVRPGGGVGVGAAGRGAGGPKRQPVGRRASAAFACRQAQGVAEGGVARGNRGGSGGPAQRGANPRPGGPPDGPGRLTASWAGKLPPFQPQGTLQLGAARSYVRGKYRPRQRGEN